jgi:hypothetical protein
MGWDQYATGLWFWASSDWDHQLEREWFGIQVDDLLDDRAWIAWAKGTTAAMNKAHAANQVVDTHA